MRFVDQDPLDRNRLPLDEWALVETQLPNDIGTAETVFTVGNGHLGLRGNDEFASDGYEFGTFVNGFHETWPIRHAENAYGFAQLGQTIINAPDGKGLRLEVNGEAFVLETAELSEYERRLDFQSGILSRKMVWTTQGGERIRIESRRLVSFVTRELAMLELTITPLDGAATIWLATELRNRQDEKSETPGEFDPRKAETVEDRVLQPRLTLERDGTVYVGSQATRSGMYVTVGLRAECRAPGEVSSELSLDADLTTQYWRTQLPVGEQLTLTRALAYATSATQRCDELADVAAEALASATAGFDQIAAAQRDWLDAFWSRTDVRIGGQRELQQAVRWNLFQLIQASARNDGGGVAAKGVSGSGYSGHYFWDTEIYVMPFLSYTSPHAARALLGFREGMLPAARERAGELNQRGALFPWRTINGQEASAYYPAGTAQYHIDADVAYALCQYVAASGDTQFLADGGIDILVETARLWADLGFVGRDGQFHIHSVTGPDEYTAVVNDNLYTNVMAKANLLAAADWVDWLREHDAPAAAAMTARLGLESGELDQWRAASEAMTIPFDEELGIHAQDDSFLTKEVWDFAGTPAEKYPLLLHFHPLVIYRHQVLKQADTVLAMLLQGQLFTPEQKRANFDYYDALTTGDSTLSGVVQSILAAEVGHEELALAHFRSGVFVDLANIHHNTKDGVHVASTGGVWSGLVFGFAGMRDFNGQLSFDPRLPSDWSALEFRLCLGGQLLKVRLDGRQFSCELDGERPLQLIVRGQPVLVTPGTETTVPLH